MTFNSLIRKGRQLFHWTCESATTTMATQCKSGRNLEENDETEVTPFKLFASRVTVAGLEEMSVAKYKSEKSAFLIGISFGAAAIVYCSYIIVLSYMGMGCVFDTTIINGYQAPFPNITVCGPESLKRSVMRRLANESPSTGPLMTKFNRTLEEGIEIMAAMSAFTFRSRPVSPLNRALMKLADEFSNSLPNGYISFLNMAHPTCAEMLTKCQFEQRVFNCCEAAQHVPFDNSVCYIVSVSKWGIYFHDPVTCIFLNPPESRGKPHCVRLLAKLERVFSFIAQNHLEGLLWKRERAPGSIIYWTTQDRFSLA